MHTCAIHRASNCACILTLGVVCDYVTGQFSLSLFCCIGYMYVTRCALINATDLLQYAIIEPVQGDVDYDEITTLQDALPPMHS